MICLDYEGSWGMPFAARYDLEAATHLILETLARHRARATFFTVGAIALEQPQLVEQIARDGHEIALHGWHHEHLDRLTHRELDACAAGLSEAEAAIASITGSQPQGFRSPYLLGPRFFHPRVHELLLSHGYLWTSDCEIRHAVELLKPHRLRSERPWRALEGHYHLLTGSPARLATLALNPRIWRSHPLGGSRGRAIRWLWSGFPPYHRGSLVEIPVYSPMDCDLLDLPEPSAPTDGARLEFARFAWLATLAQPTPFAMLTFHDWIITGANRLSLLDRTLSSMAQLGLEAVSLRDAWPQLADAAARSPLRAVSAT